MSIRLDHTHDDGRRCFEVTYPGQFSQMGIFRDNDGDFGAAYLSSRKAWQVFDLESGRQIATLDPVMYERLLARYRISDLPWPSKLSDCPCEKPIKPRSTGPIFGEYFADRVPDVVQT